MLTLTALLISSAGPCGERPLFRPRSSAALNVTTARVGFPVGHRIGLDSVQTTGGKKLSCAAVSCPQSRSDVRLFSGNAFRIAEQALSCARPGQEQCWCKVVLYDCGRCNHGGAESGEARLKRAVPLATGAERRRVAAQGRKLVVIGVALSGLIAPVESQAHRSDALILIVYTGSLLIIVGVSDAAAPAVRSARPNAAVAAPTTDNRLLIVADAGEIGVVQSAQRDSVLESMAKVNAP